MNSKKNLKRNLLICLLAGSAVMYTLPLHAATSVIGNNTLPSGGQLVHGEGNIASSGLEMNITQNGQNAVIKWNDFSVGGNATVNFDYTGKDNFNTLNYVNSGKVSQIYGTINAQHEGYNGNIFIVNTAGVQIGPSAQINVGSLHVSNKYLNESELGDFAGKITPEMINTGKNADAVLMSLGNINAGEVTFEGNGRIVIDSERIKDEAGNDKLGYKNINITTSADNTDNIIIGYDGYDATIDKDTGKAIGYAGANGNTEKDRLVTINGNDYFTKADGYMWVEDVEQLQAINTNLSGNYALRNSIDATGTTNWSDPEVDGKNEGFLPIGIHNDGKVYETTVDGETKYGFYGNFDGVDYNIFGLTINREDTNNVGLFGVAHDANINNVTLVGGSITGGSVVGSVVGAALGSTHITNATNSASVTGTTDVGGIVGASRNERISDGNNGTISVDTNAVFTDLVNTGTIKGTDFNDNVTDTSISNTGGLIGYMYNGTLKGNSYNLGDVSSEGHNVGGLVGHAVNSTIGNPSVVNGKPVENVQVVYNRLDVTGAYNVGGIVGNMAGSTVQNAENSGTVLASGSLTDEYNYHTDIANENNLPAGSSLSNGIVSIDVNVANAGGIAGSSSDSSIIKDVTNTGDVSSRKQEGTENINGQNYNYEYYTAGNVGGIVGSAADTNITNATNRENEIRGAHNVGGVVGYFSGNGTIDKGINDGGDIMATGAHNGKGFVMESVRQGGDEDFIIGNIGGIVGYMEGNDVKVTGSANRGTVHTENIEDADNVLTISKAANVGGIVGKIDASTNTNETGLLTNFRNGNYKNASVSNSYNTGNVTGYTGVGGVIGMMYNGSVAGSYNQGAINTTRQVDRGGGSNIDPLNMGGIVGDTTEQTSASAVIYDVYNEGQIGDENFEFYARHVGGIVGRLSGTVEKAYNTGDIYNNDTAVGGIVGWWYNGNIKNVFNTGNITVRSATELQVGGIAGAAAGGVETLENAYNLGTIRGYKEGVDASNNPINGTDDYIYVGGIIGRARGGNALTIRNVYTMGNLYAGVGDYDENTNSYSYTSTANGLGAIYGGNEAPTLQGANYIKPDSKYFKDLSGQIDVNDIEYKLRYNQKEYSFVNALGVEDNDNMFSSLDKGAVNNATDDNWRIYEGSTTPILNAFLPNVKDYFANNNNMTNISTIQYGTAYNPLLTIIKATGDLSYDWKKLGISGAASLAVYGGGLTLDNVDTSGGTGYYSGLLYTDKDLTLIATNKNNEPDATKVSGDIGLGSGAELYGSSVKIEADGTVTVYGSVTATGETAGSTGDINITAGDVDVYGTLTTGKPVSIAGIEGSAQKVDTNFENVNNPNEAMIHISERFAHEIDSANGATNNITINAGTKLVVGDDGNPILDKDGNEQYVNIGDGNVNLYFGNKEQGLITTGGDLTVTGTGDVYVDSDLDIGGNLTLTGNGENSEVVLDLTNIGQVQAKNELAENPNSNVTALDKFHYFMHHFGSQIGDDNRQIMLNAKISGDAKLTIDMWDKTQNNGQGGYNLNKYDQNTGHDLVTELNNLNINADIKTNNGTIGNVTSAKPITYIWVSDGDQLQAINNNGVNGLSYNYALKNDINASDVTGYEAIGTNIANGFIGTFDGRGNRIIGLDTTKDANVGNTNAMVNAGIFSTIGEGGTVKNVNIYSGNFTGTDTAGAVAGVNKGRIENVTGFGNTVEVIGAGIAGGIVGKNEGKGTFGIEDGASTLTGNGIYDVQSIGSVITASGVAGGLVGTNNGALGNSYSDSAVTSTLGTSAGLGGIAGVNTGDVQFVDSLGVTNGGTNSDKVGGIIGVNEGNMYSGYNESIVSGKDNVGGIIGVNTNTVSNIVNATGINGNDYVGGLVGDNDGNVSSGRNNGTITGNDYVGGMVGSNGAGSILKNLVNAESADIVGEDYVGGIAGTNSGEITADDQSTLDNLGSITGQNYVGGVAGENIGKIEYIKTNISLNVKDTNEDAQYFGGIAGINGRVDDNPNDGVDNDKTGTITSATNEGNVIAADADYVGGIVGLNTANGQLLNSSNAGRVEGANYVGGVAGKNEASITGEANDLVTIDNSGVVIAHEGGAGGIFGENTGKIGYAELTNNGIVSGTYNADKVAGTGGIIGVNSGDIKHSSLKNNIGGQVIGTQNVGGLIGVNSGNIEGGRNEQEVDKDGKETVAADSYYKYQIYNNGVINVGTWIDGNNNGLVDACEIQGVAEDVTSTNIGGLIGSNEETGILTAGYNTGAINAGSSTNVGGIVGNNAGTVDQVFNTVMTENGTGAISGGNNVGGLVGTNSGTLSNAYNTTEVTSTNSGVVGNAVGENSGTITNIYASNIIGNLIGTGYDNGKVTNAYSFATGDSTATKVLTDKSVQKAEESYGFDNKNDGTTWKFYDGYSNPLLKVFLTTLTVDSDQVDLVYNAGEQDLNIGELVGNVITAPIVKDGEEIIYNGLDAYYNTVINGSDLGESELLQNTMGQKDAGTYDNWLYSGQIASGSKDGSGFNPNNLGYDIVYTKNDSGETGVEIGKATINIDLGKVEHTYGNADVINGTGNFKNEAGYGFNITNSNLTQEMKDELNDKGLGFVFEKDNALTGDTSGRVTEDVKDGGYTWSANFELSEELKKNYQFDDNGSATLNKADGQSIVNQAKLEISVDDAETMPGVVPNFTGTNIQQGLVNGDVAGNYDYALDSSVDINVDDIYTDKIGISFGNSETYYDLDNVDWSTIPGWEFLKNYDINFDPGTLTVDSEVMPDLPDNWPNNRWDYLFNDAPFDRNKDFRERKAEVNFVDGAMEI